jgi:hypothetical protein
VQTYSTQTGNGPSTADQAKDKAQQAAGQAQEKAQEAAGQAKGALRKQVDERSTDAGQRVSGFASDVRSVSDQLRQQGKDQPAKLADQAAERAERVSDYLTRSDGQQILNDVEDLARRQPWVVIGSGLILGLAASRFLKASSSRRYEQRWESSNRLPARTYDVSPSTSGIHTHDVGTSLPPRDVTLTGDVPTATPGAVERGR